MRNQDAKITISPKNKYFAVGVINLALEWLIFSNFNTGKNNNFI
jgi:hypothetical protein